MIGEMLDGRGNLSNTMYWIAHRGDEVAGIVGMS